MSCVKSNSRNEHDLCNPPCDREYLQKCPACPVADVSKRLEDFHRPWLKWKVVTFRTFSSCSCWWCISLQLHWNTAPSTRNVCPEISSNSMTHDIIIRPSFSLEQRIYQNVKYWLYSYTPDDEPIPWTNHLNNKTCRIRL